MRKLAMLMAGAMLLAGCAAGQAPWAWTCPTGHCKGTVEEHLADCHLYEHSMQGEAVEEGRLVDCMHQRGYEATEVATTD